jgi:hypothetical protein
MNKNFGIAGGIKGMAFGQQFVFVFAKIVNFAIKNNTNTFVLIVNRLISGIEVYNGQATVPKTKISIRIHRKIVGTAMLYNSQHIRHKRRIVTIFLNYSADSAHDF